jgi:GR25 family glycosyltransferase involved in LPS biosynthesis
VRACVITLAGHGYSEAAADRCIDSANIPVERFRATPAEEAEDTLRAFGLRWTWGEGRCPTTGLRMHRYGGHLARIGCAMSHFRLWLECAESGAPLMILEHDAVFLRPFEPFQFQSACQLNDPAGATRRGDWWSAQMAKRGPGVWPKTWVTDPRERIPDGLAGNSAYVLQPWTAARLVALYRDVGVWPNDATLCAQLVPGLQEVYPFVTRVAQSVSTTSA